MALQLAATPAFQPIATERLLLRPLRPEDAEAIHRLMNDWEVVRMLAAAAVPVSPRRWPTSGSPRRASRSSAAAATICDHRPGGRPGDAGRLRRPAARQQAARRQRSATGSAGAFWGHGVATEAAGAAGALGAGQSRPRPADRQCGDRQPGVRRRAAPRRLPRGRRRAWRRSWRAAASTRCIRSRRRGTTCSASPTRAPAAERHQASLLVAACALIDADGRVLLTRRPEGKTMAGLWEFPGGKLHPGETPEAGLVRELKEELGIDVTHACLAPFAFASHRLSAVSIC